MRSSSANFAGTKATRAYSNCLNSAVYISLYLANIGLPCSVCFTMRVGNSLSENDTLSANTALCHIDTSSNAQMRIYVL